MSAPRPEERWVAACIEAALPGVIVRHHDDGSRPGMHDLDLIEDDHVFAACEVTAAADAESIELWNLVNGGGHWIEPALAGGWMLTLAPSCRAKRLKAEAPALLARLEAEQSDSDALDGLRQVGVLDVHQSGTDFAGSIYVTIERDSIFTGGMVADHGDALVTWLDGWLRTAEQDHNLRKLRAATAAERHLFVLAPGFSSAPFTAADLLMRDDAPLPRVVPSLPLPLTQIWVMSTWDSGRIFHWTGSQWTTYPKVFDICA